MARNPASGLAARTAGTEARRTRSRDPRLDPDTPVLSIIGGPLRWEFAAVPMSPILKRVMGFTHFRLRGFAGAEIEWQIATLAYNCRRIHRLQALAGA